MKKVVFSVIRAGKNENRMSGIGYITETDLLIPAISKNGKPYIRVFEDYLRYCHKIPNENEEYKGTIYEFHAVEFETRKVKKHEKLKLHTLSGTNSQNKER